MEFNDSFEIEDVAVESVWDALSDPVTVRNSLPGCKCLVEVEDPDNVDFDQILEDAESNDEEESFDADELSERQFKQGSTYASVISVSIGPVNPRFDTLVTIDKRDYPSMGASGEGSSGDSTFEMDSYMTLEETENGVAVDWEAEVDIVGRLANIGQRMIQPAANRIVKKFFSDVEQELSQKTADETESTSSSSVEKGLFARLKRLLGIGKGA